MAALEFRRVTSNNDKDKNVNTLSTPKVPGCVHVFKHGILHAANAKS